MEKFIRMINTDQKHPLFGQVRHFTAHTANHHTTKKAGWVEQEAPEGDSLLETLEEAVKNAGEKTVEEALDAAVANAASYVAMAKSSLAIDIEAAKMPELRAYCKEREWPEEEWKGIIKKEELKSYINTKLLQ